MKIAVLSDTHGLLRPEVIQIIKTCDAVIHAGDINSQKIIDEMKAAAKPDIPFYIVRGNNDKNWAEHLPHHLEFTLSDINFYVVHNKKDLPDDLNDRQIIVFGHSHKYLEEIHEGRLWLNPGSCGKRRFHQKITMAVLTIMNGTWKVEQIDIPHSAAITSGKPRQTAVPEGEVFQVTSEILKRMEKGQSIIQIASEMKIDFEFIEQVCRIRMTHPGVTTKEILDKMEVNQTGR